MLKASRSRSKVRARPPKRHSDCGGVRLASRMLLLFRVGADRSRARRVGRDINRQRLPFSLTPRLRALADDLGQSTRLIDAVQDYPVGSDFGGLLAHRF